MDNKDLLKKDGFKGEWMYVLPTEAFTQFIKNCIVSRLYLTDVGYFPNALGHYRERPDGIAENIYIYCMDGKGFVELEGKAPIMLGKGDAFCIPAFTGHKYYADKENPWSILWIHFKGNDVEFYPIQKLEPVHLSAKGTDARMLSLFTEMYEILGQSYSLGNFITLTNVISVILSTTYLMSQSEIKNDLVTRVIKFMYANIDKSLSLADLSEEFKISASYLSAQFKENTGRSPMDFFNKIKIDEACKLLLSTDLHVYEISQKVGFSDQYYFSRLFSKIAGCSPRDYRKR